MSKMLAVFVMLFSALPLGAQVPGSMNIGSISFHDWPSPSPSIMRPRAGAEWRQIEPERGTFYFPAMDGWIAAAQAHNTQILFTFLNVPAWAAADTTLPPSDLDATNETCQAPLAGVVRSHGNCMYAEFVTMLMQHVCGVTRQPIFPLSTCSIRIFESWNEFNDGQFWGSNYTNMAKMANDAATIIRLYCSNCTVLAGNTSAGGDGSNPHLSHSATYSGQFDIALRQMLYAWYSIPNGSYPDGVSFHAYGAIRTVTPYPMPETNISHGDPRCTAALVPNSICRTAIKDQVAAIRAALVDFPEEMDLPVWATEGGFGRNDDMTDAVSQTDYNTNFLRQAYVARWMLALASAGTVTNLWYEYDDQCWGTMDGIPNQPSWSGCSTDAPIASGFTPIHQTWVQMLSFLNGVTFDGPCTSTGTLWQCDMTTPDGAREQFLWTTQWLGTEQASVGQGFSQYVDLTGAVHPLNGAKTITVTNQPVLVKP